MKGRGRASEQGGILTWFEDLKKSSPRLPLPQYGLPSLVWGTGRKLKTGDAAPLQCWLLLSHPLDPLLEESHCFHALTKYFEGRIFSYNRTPNSRGSQACEWESCVITSKKQKYQ